MLHRPTSAPAWSPARRVSIHLGALTGPASGLLRFVLITAILAAIGCLYLWQVNDLSTLHDNTEKLHRQAGFLEQQNVVLAEQLARWNAPAYVEELSTQQGYVFAPKRLIAPMADAAPADAAPVAGAPADAALVAGAPAAVAVAAAPGN